MTTSSTSTLFDSFTAAPDCHNTSALSKLGFKYVGRRFPEALPDLNKLSLKELRQACSATYIDHPMFGVLLTY